MSKELLDLMQRVRVKRYKESDPKGLVFGMVQEIRMKRYYGNFQCWEMMVENLARWLVLNNHIGLACMPPLKGFEGLSLKKDEVYEHLESLDLFRHYVTAAKEKPWDYIGEAYTELGLVGLGQNMTPRAVIELMIKSVYTEEVTELKTQLDPCVGTGRFLFITSQMMPKAPLVLFGIEINPALYRACLVNMAIFSNHPYSIICADSLRLEPNKSGPISKIWDLGNRWDPPDMSAYYWKPPPIWHDRFSLKAFTELDKK